jgi:hypothetical protein
LSKLLSKNGDIQDSIDSALEAKDIFEKISKHDLKMYTEELDELRLYINQ